MFPATLLIEGRPCLIVGGGRVAARKAAKLIEAGAVLTIVAPSIRDQIKSMGSVNLQERAFDEKDLEKIFLVFAATDDHALNQRIVQLAQEKNILCSAADSSWSEGDLIMPASFSDDGLTVAISTGGQACKRSRLLRESLSRHIEFLQDVDLFIMGGNTDTLDIDELEKIKSRRNDVERILPCVQGVHEFMILDTCNRFEIVGLISSHTDLNLFLPQFPLCAKGFGAFARLAQIAAGLQSDILGESRIVAQLKDSLDLAQQRGWAGSFLQGWADQALRISKEIRNTTGAQIPALEIEDMVFQYLEKNRPDFPNIGKILIVGRGEIGNGVAAKLNDSTQISGRDRAELAEQLPDADVIICATGNADLMIHQDHQAFLKPNALLIDLSVPRNVDPELPGVVGLNGLRAVATPEIKRQLFELADEIIKKYETEYQRIIRFEHKVQ